MKVTGCVASLHARRKQDDCKASDRNPVPLCPCALYYLPTGVESALMLARSSQLPKSPSDHFQFQTLWDRIFAGLYILQSLYQTP